MSFRTDLAMAPEQRGLIGAVSAWSGGATSTSVLTLTGTYTGTTTVTLTFSANSVITVGTTTFPADWDGSDGTSGVLQIGAGYVAGTALLFFEGVSLAAAAGTFGAAGETATVTLTAARALPDEFALLDALQQDNPAGTCDVILDAIGRESRDTVHGFVNGDAGVQANTIARSPSIRLDWLEDDQGDDLRHLEGTRKPIMVGENFDSSTVLLWRGGSTTPLIGPVGTFVRATAGAYHDKRTGLLRVAASGTSRQMAGKAGLGFLMDGQAVTNLLPRFHPKSGTLAWTATGSATVTWDPGVAPVLDRDDTGWAAAFRAGVARVNLPVGAHSIHNTTDATIVPGVHASQVWVRGRGIITASFRSDTGVPAATVRATSASFTLTSSWQRLTVNGTAVAGNDTADIQIVAVTHNTILYVSAAQMETGSVATMPIQTDGAPATRNAETMTFPLTVPADFGTLSFWFYWPGDDSASTYLLYQAGGVAGSERFECRYNSSTSNLNFYTDTGTPIQHSIDLVANTWYHVAFTWSGPGAGASQIIRVLFFNGAAVSSTQSTNWQPFFGNTLAFNPQLTGVGIQGIRFEEVRLDKQSITAATDLYGRLTDEAWLHVHRELAGRAFNISSLSMNRRSDAHPDQYLATMSLAQVRAYDDSLVTAR